MKNYNQHSQRQRATALKNLPKVVEAAHRILEINSNIYRFMDYGCSEGRNSCIIFKSMCEDLRTFTAKEFFIIHSDLPSIDWAAFFVSVNDPQFSYLTIPNTYSSAIAKSFYEQCVPHEFVHFGYSHSAFHWDRVLSPNINWLESTECPLEHIQNIIEDKVTLLNHRYNELVHEGILFFYAGSKREVDHLALICQSLLKNLCNKGFITEEEITKFRLPVTWLSIHQWKTVLNKFSDKFEVLSFEEIKTPIYPSESTKAEIEKINHIMIGETTILVKEYFEMIVNDELRKQSMLNVLEEETFIAINENVESGLVASRSHIRVLLKKY